MDDVKNMNEKLDALYAKIPSFSCKKGCHDCCGPVAGIKAELDRLPITAAVRPLKDGLTCGFWNCGCTIYAYRPLACRMFGVASSKRMQCPYSGYSPVGPARLLSAAEEKAIMTEYMRLGETDDGACRLTGGKGMPFFRVPDGGMDT